MYCIYFVWRDDWGDLSYHKRPGLVKKLGTAIRLAKRYGHNSYVKKYGDPRPIWINNNELNSHLEQI